MNVNPQYLDTLVGPKENIHIELHLNMLYGFDQTSIASPIYKGHGLIIKNVSNLTDLHRGHKRYYVTYKNTQTFSIIDDGHVILSGTLLRRCKQLITDNYETSWEIHET